ncbi:hypothetical protein MRX96_035125 [Rhipicephalus microplus]
MFTESRHSTVQKPVGAAAMLATPPVTHSHMRSAAPSDSANLAHSPHPFERRSRGAVHSCAASAHDLVSVYTAVRKEARRRPLRKEKEERCRDIRCR